MLKFVKRQSLFPKDLHEEFLRNNTEYNNISAMFLAIVFIVLSCIAISTGYYSRNNPGQDINEFFFTFTCYVIGFILSVFSLSLLLMLRKRKMSYHWISDLASLTQTIMLILIFQVTSHIEALKTGNKNVNIIIISMFCVILFVRLKLWYMLTLEAGITILTIIMLYIEKESIFNFYTSLVNITVAGIIAFIAAYSYWRSRYDSFLDAEELKKLVAYDVLTNVLNRRGFDTVFSHSWNEAIREKKQLALFIIDIDHFKNYNDTYGHVEGDACLASIAEILAGSIRENDFVARYGGEEFAIIMLRTDSSAAELVAERIFANIKEKNILHKNSIEPYVTVSIGCMTAFPTADGMKPGEFIVMADQALYMAKEAGRNRFVIHPGSYAPSGVVEDAVNNNILSSGFYEEAARV